MNMKLATFKIEEEKWKAFQEIAEAEGSSASALLKDFINWTLAGNRLNETVTPDIDERIDAKLAPLQAQIEELRGKFAA
jgi:hypothetical protein